MSEEIDAEEGCTSADVSHGYRVFLGRPAEEEYPSLWANGAELAKHFLGSDEFDQEVAKPIAEGRFPSAGRFMGTPSATILDWMGHVLPVSASTRKKLAKATTWTRALYLLFADPEFSQIKSRLQGGRTMELLAQRLLVQEKADRRANASGGVLGRSKRRLGSVSTLAAGKAGDDDAFEIKARLDVDASSGEEEAPFLPEWVDLIAKSELFDRAYYARVSKRKGSLQDLAKHYLLVGEAAGLKPSPEFDPKHYNERHPDVEEAGLNTLLHFELSGRKEGRNFGSAAVDRIQVRERKIDPAKSTIVLICHEASRTGAPVLGWNLVKHFSGKYNVVVVLIDGGELEDSFAEIASAVVGPVRHICHDLVDLRMFSARLTARFKPLYAIGNSVESGPIGIALRQTGLPFILLVHEFSSHAYPRGGALTRLYLAADHIVFPAEVVAQSSIADYDFLRLQNVHVIAQGPSDVPPNHIGRTKPKTSIRPKSFLAKTKEALTNLFGGAAAATTTEPLPNPAATGKVEHSRLLYKRELDDGTVCDFVVVGLGTVDFRKGVDLFVATAQILRRIAPDLKIGFLWVGHQAHPPGPYQIILREQVERSALGDSLEILLPTDDLESVYANCDALYVSSRLDPLPNVALDAALRGLPIICFEGATGMADFLKGGDASSPLAVPHLDIGAAAEAIVKLARDKAETKRVGASIMERAAEAFDMPRYAAKLDEIGQVAVKHAAAAKRGVELLHQEGRFEPALFAGKAAEKISKSAVIDLYLDECRRVAFNRPPVLGLHQRRPVPGFNPLTYAVECKDFPKDGSANPFLHWLEAGSPKGPWSYDTILLGSQRKRKSKLRAAMHGHFHYIDNFGEFLETLKSNNSEIDLFLTATSQPAATYLKKLARGYRSGKVDVRIVPNSGRDVGPFLRLFEDGSFDGYDVVGHIHGKRSLHTAEMDAELGDRWRTFLWQSLLGPTKPAADIILGAMEKDAALGLVFPQNPELIGWERNVPEATKLAKRMGLPTPLPIHVDFPVGTMFWARPGALQPFIDAAIRDDEYPPEPLPVDGTILHAFERLLSPAATHAGYKIGSVYNPLHVRT